MNRFRPILRDDNLLETLIMIGLILPRLIFGVVALIRALTKWARLKRNRQH